jgi:hypothetical protein
MINVKNLLMLSVLFAAVAGFTIAPACATASDGWGATASNLDRTFAINDATNSDDSTALEKIRFRLAGTDQIRVLDGGLADNNLERLTLEKKIRIRV